jgi:hypothetical protein
MAALFFISLRKWEGEVSGIKRMNPLIMRLIQKQEEKRNYRPKQFSLMGKTKRFDVCNGREEGK